MSLPLRIELLKAAAAAAAPICARGPALPVSADLKDPAVAEAVLQHWYVIKSYYQGFLGVLGAGGDWGDTPDAPAPAPVVTVPTPATPAAGSAVLGPVLGAIGDVAKVVAAIPK